MDELSFDTFETHALQAERSLSQGQYRAAFEKYREILRLRTSSRDSSGSPPVGGDLEVIERLASLAALFGEYRAADHLYASYAGFAAAAGNRYAADYATLTRAHLALCHGALREAESHLRSLGPDIAAMESAEFSMTGLTRWEQGLRWRRLALDERAVLLTRIYLLQGLLLAANGQYAGAVLVLDQGIHHAGAQAPPLARSAWIPLQLARATALLEMGELTLAEKALSTLEPRLDSRLDPGFFVQWCESLGKLDMLRGEFGAALERFRSIVAICRKGEFGRAYLQAALHLAHIQILLNHTSDAAIQLVEIRDAAHRLGEDSLALRARFLLVVARARSQSLADGVPIAPSVSAMWDAEEEMPAIAEEDFIGSPLDLPQPQSFLSLFEDRALAFHWYLGQRQIGSAQQVLHWMDDAFDATDSELIFARLTVMRGMLAYYQGDYDKAEQGLESGRSLLDRIGLKPELWQAIRVLGWCSVKRHKPDARRESLAAIADELLRQLTQSLAVADQTVFLLNKWTAEEEYIAAVVNKLAQMRAGIRDAPWYQRAFRRYAFVTELHRFVVHLQAYQTRLAESLAGESRFKSLRTMLPEHALSALLRHPASRATISFVVLPDRVVIIERGFLKLDFGVSALTRIELRQRVRAWHEAVQQSLRPANAAPGATEAAGTSTKRIKTLTIDRLANDLQLSAILRRLPRRVRALTIEPDDSLHGLPFAALNHDGKYLVERYALCVRPLNSGVVRWSRDSQPVERALLVAVSQGAAGFCPLEGAIPEIERVCEQLAGCGVSISELQDASATKSVLAEKFPNAQLVHIACHGEFRSDQPDQSGLVLVPVPNHVEILSLRELRQWDLSGVGHVTLSSCWSADNFILPGRWIISLPHTLCLAGVKSVLGCLWPVDDRLAVEFMSRFYRHLRDLPRDEALRQTQLSCIRGVVRDESGEPLSPYFWAGFTLYGKPDVLPL